jgi:hypothetical protein
MFGDVGVSSHNLMHQIESKQGELRFWTFGVIWANFSRIIPTQAKEMFVYMGFDFSI